MSNSVEKYRELKARVEAKHGPLHPKVLELPLPRQLELLRQADEDDLILDEQRIETYLADLNERIALVGALAKVTD